MTRHQNVPPYPRGFDLNAIGAGLRFEQLRPILVKIDVPALQAAVAACDAALAHRDQLSAARPRSVVDVTSAYQAAIVDHDTAIAAANKAIGARNYELAEVLYAAAPVAIHVLAVERARMLAEGLDPTATHNAVNELWHLPGWWPPLAYGPGHRRRATREPVVWWPPFLVVPPEAVEVELRRDANEWQCSLLAARKRRGYTVTDDGAVQFSEVWRFPDRYLGPDELVMIGTGPNGEQGVDPAETRWGLHRVAFD